MPVAVAMWFFVMHDYQKQRVLTFLDPESDPLGTGLGGLGGAPNFGTPPAAPATGGPATDAPASNAPAGAAPATGSGGLDPLAGPPPGLTAPAPQQPAN